MRKDEGKKGNIKEWEVLSYRFSGALAGDDCAVCFVDARVPLTVIQCKGRSHSVVADHETDCHTPNHCNPGSLHLCKLPGLQRFGV